MGERVEEIRRKLLQVFPKLSQDKDFLVTSNPTPDYNCIAWACKYEDRWIQPHFAGRPALDSVIWWPPDVKEGLDIDCLKKVFEYHGYSECESHEHEDGYRKVALYFDEQTKFWTHASRELSNGFWSSKLGTYNDIQHGNPFSIENDTYGKAYCFMKVKFEQ